MTLRRFVLISFVLCASFVGSTSAVRAEPLWQSLVPGRAVEADPLADYTLTDVNGPWLVMATTFSGEGAEDQARGLVLELRRRYKLESFIHHMTFDFTDGVRGRGIDPTGQPVRMKYRKSMAIKEIAVLVGSFPSVDDPNAQETLRKIKYMQPETLDLTKVKKTNQTLAALRTIQKMVLPEDDDRRKRGPMSKAFITRNPLLPEEYFDPGGVDNLVAQMNAGVKYSLLDCPGNYTVKVATFGGTVVLDQKQVQQYEGGKPMKSKLAEAAENAHNLTLALRSKGWEAYEFHDRTASMVTVGSFDSVGTPRIDGRTELHPQIFKIMKVFGASPRTGADALPNIPGAHTTFKLKSLMGIPLDVQPEVVHVPKRSISSDYVRE